MSVPWLTLLGLIPLLGAIVLIYFLIVVAVGGTTSITGPLLAALLLGGTFVGLTAMGLVHARTLARPWLGTALRTAAGPIVGLLLVAYSVASYHLVLGVPGLPYTGAFARFMGWQQATGELQAVQARLQQATGLAPVVVGLDKYNTASQIAFYGAAPFVPPGQAALKATSLETFNGNALMFTYWNPPASLAGRPMILVAREREDLAKAFRDGGISFTGANGKLQFRSGQASACRRRKHCCIWCGRHPCGSKSSYRWPWPVATSRAWRCRSARSPRPWPSSATATGRQTRNPECRDR